LPAKANIARRGQTQRGRGRERRRRQKERERETDSKHCPHLVPEVAADMRIDSTERVVKDVHIGILVNRTRQAVGGKKNNNNSNKC
jgi:hypothetical protein